MMSSECYIPDVVITRNPNGSYALYVDHAFCGNYDTHSEAANAVFENQ